METRNGAVERLKIGTAKLEVYVDKKSAGTAAAQAIAQTIQELDQSGNTMSVIFATGASQLATLDALTTIPNLPWHNIRGFHLDEYVGLAINHPASFRRYLHENLTQRVPIGEFFEIDGNARSLDRMCREYAERLRVAAPQLCLLGIGENGHLAFNDPSEANFDDPVDVKVVHLDTMCRQQQAAEGWFPGLKEVPEQAITLTIPALFRVPKLIVSVPGSRKAQIVRRALEEPVSTKCPATLLRQHPDATIYLDLESATELDGFSLLD